ncbi:YecA family protein [Clostridium estertheticum]|uniref:YecA family protein n=1 Tax=Clostridium estertheticum TaxID=238834 RepID=UPI00217ECD9B|nr:SEC-C metal-binding domain-containing protein [Clostridium estertheticum]
MCENRRFNRCETEYDHYYIEEFGNRVSQVKTYSGYIKCKLAHQKEFSVIIPDQIYLESDCLLWFQPLSFLPNILYKLDDCILGQIQVDISCGNTLKIEFKNHDYIRSFDDGSNLFKCIINGPRELETYATGTAIFKEDSIPFLDLYHHTSIKNYIKIMEGSYFIVSKWNIQGNKELKNIGYLYLTCLDAIEKDGDLKQIAMSSDGKIQLMRDNFSLPNFMPPNWKELYSGDILELEVYRENTVNRTERIRLSVDSSLLAPQYILRHNPRTDGVYYQICNPFIYRIGQFKGQTLEFVNLEIKSEKSTFKKSDYVVLGDATTLNGLAAPYDEENTKHIFKIEKLSDTTTILDFWFDNRNMDHFSSRSINLQEFEMNNAATSKKIGRNDRCPCSSGKKYKKCCGLNN